MSTATSLLVATWVTGGATAVLAIGAGFTVYYARQAFMKQSAELEDQRETNKKLAAAAELQTEELRASRTQREREAEEIRRAQASKVNAWFGSRLDGGTVFYGSDGPLTMTPPIPTWGAIIRNDSDLPVLSVQASFYFVAAESPAAENWTAAIRGTELKRIRVIPPHSERFIEIPEDIRSKHPDCSDAVYAAGIEFTDAAGIRWERDPYGALKER